MFGYERGDESRTSLGRVVGRLRLRDVDDLWGVGYQPRRRGRSDRAMRGLTLALMLATKTILPPPWGIMLRAASRAVKNAP